MFDKELKEKMNEQYIFEIYSANAYLAMASYFQEKDLDGFAHFFKKQAQEETEHAMKYFEFLHDRGARVDMTSIPAPDNDFKDPIDVFEKAAAHEKEVTERIHALVDLSRAKNDHPSFAFLQWFVTEQVEEENTFSKLLGQLRTMNENKSILYILDGRLHQRA